VIRKEAWPFYRTISGVRLCWELEKPKGPKGRGTPVQHMTSFSLLLTHQVMCPWTSPRSWCMHGGRVGINTVTHPVSLPIRPWSLSRLSLGGRVLMNKGHPARQWRIKVVLQGSGAPGRRGDRTVIPPHLAPVGSCGVAVSYRRGTPVPQD